ncbi:hypothetical protein PORCAN_479 [Porphyromonas crevioricanis JCM 13913]|nr:hypothetical protein PORCAN_479 [Porphyromonas crevioricanis JCM 13913]
MLSLQSRDRGTIEKHFLDAPCNVLLYIMGSVGIQKEGGQNILLTHPPSSFLVGYIFTLSVK